MLIKLKVTEGKELVKGGKMSEAFAELVPSYFRDDTTFEFDHLSVEPADVVQLRALSERQRKANPKVVNGLAQKLAMIDRLELGVDKVKITRLDQLDEAIKVYVRNDNINCWLFSADADGRLFPYLVEDVKYTPASGSGDRRVEAYVTVQLAANSPNERGRSQITFHAKDLVGGGRTVHRLLGDEGYVRESRELVDAHEAAVARYAEFVQQDGHQFLGRGRAHFAGRYSYGTTSLERDGVRAKLVNDEGAREEKQEVRHRADDTRRAISYLGASRASAADDEGTVADDRFFRPVPLHPWVYCYHLDEDEQVWVHADDLEPYAYDPALREKIVLPAEHKRLIDILTADVHEHLEDIIQGKTGGTIVLAQGDPGTGKTLTAEVYSEVVERPLYKVRSSQLGLDIDHLEKNLKAVLARASRWGAVLLLDEADVYVRARGTDIEQNAVVGVFLRVLEYYRGLLIMTTNRDLDIDDAIVSRCTAVIRYERPKSADDRLAIWRILNEQFGKRVDDNVLVQLARTYEDVSGRYIKNLLKLAIKYSGGQPSPADFGHCAQFLPGEGGAK